MKTAKKVKSQQHAKAKTKRVTAQKRIVSTTSKQALDLKQVATVSAEEISKLARAGVPRSSVTAVIDQKHTSLADLASVLGINERTVRTYRTKKDPLSPQQAEQLLKYRRLLHQGKETFGSGEAFDRWLRKPAFGLDNERPMDLLVTSEGINLVSDEVERIANGEFA